MTTTPDNQRPFTPGESELCASCGYAEWRHHKGTHPCKKYQSSQQPDYAQELIEKAMEGEKLLPRPDNELDSIIDQCVDSTKRGLHPELASKKAKQRLNALIEDKVREARVDEVQLAEQSNQPAGGQHKPSYYAIDPDYAEKRLRTIQLQDNQAKEDV